MSPGRLTTHVLDLVAGGPAGGIALELHRLAPDRQLLLALDTNADGRPDEPLLEGERLVPGHYELLFMAGPYLRRRHGDLTPFLEEIPVRFTVADVSQHYHVPLLLAAYGYTTYRGS